MQHATLSILLESYSLARTICHSCPDLVSRFNCIREQMVSKSKLRRLGSLAKTAKISLAVDSCENLQDVSDVASDMGVNIDIVVELSVGGFR